MIEHPSKKQTTINKTTWLWGGMIAVTVLGLTGYSYVALNFEIFSAFYTTLLAAILLGMFSMTPSGGAAKQYLSSVWVEANKVSWPKRDEAVTSALIVVLGMAFFSVVIKIMDASVSSMLSWVLN